MSFCVVDISVSVDGYMAAPGEDVELLHVWALEPTEEEARILDATVARTGAVVMGRRTFDIVDSPQGWDDEMGYGARRDQSQAPPNFVVTSAEPSSVRLRDITFVTDGVGSALEQARAAAGDRDVFVMGGADVIQQFLAEGLVDELSLHVAPVILGGGTPLFRDGGGIRELEQVAAVTTPHAHHLTYRVPRRQSRARTEKA